MTDLTFNAVRKSFGSLEIVKGIDLDVRSGEFVVFVGPSGCGKSTLLRMVAGLEDVSSGRIFVGGVDVTNTPPAQRGIAMVFQSYALFPHMSVAENISFGMRLAHQPRELIDRRVNEVAQILQIKHLLDRRPKQLSGGQRQRVAIGRAIIRNPKVFLFDEPLSNLDAALRVQMRLEIARLHSELGATMVYVTHDQVEAMTLADRIVVLNAGRIEQVGTPIELYDRPANRFVAQFIGSPHMNFLTGQIVMAEGRSVISVGSARADLSGDFASARAADVTVGVRPEHLTIGGGTALLEGTVAVIERLGSESIVYLDSPHAPDPIAIKTAAACEPKLGARVPVGISGGAMHLFDANGDIIERVDSLAARTA
jgi:multiple sugar transport system ATP-binding protein